MKKILLIIGTVLLSLISTNAKTLKTNLQIIVFSKTTISKANIIEVFDWKVKTNFGEYSGVATSLFNAKKMMSLATIGELIESKTVTSYHVLKTYAFKNSNRVYYWEVKSDNGFAKGFSKNEFTAKKMIDLVAKGDIISFKIIINKLK